MTPPSTGGNGKFVVHANLDRATPASVFTAPFGIGDACFSLLLPEASPLGVWNNIGKPAKVGTSNDLNGTPIADPERAPTFLFFLPDGDPVTLPPGTTITFQGVIADPGSSSTRGFSMTNAVVLEILP